MPVRVERDDTIGIVTLSSADGLNVLSRAMLRDLSDALWECNASSAMRGIVLRAEGRSFSAGADITEFPYGEDAYDFLHEVLGLLSTPERIPKPVVAAVETSARAGGFELCLACDWIVAGAGATFGLPEVSFGFVPGYSMSRLPFLVGEARARRLMLDPGPYVADELIPLGIHVSTPLSSEGVVDGALRLCRRMSVGAPKSIRSVKGMTNRLVRSPDFEPVVAAYTYLFKDDASAEGLAAFQERRPPEFW